MPMNITVVAPHLSLPRRLLPTFFQDQLSELLRHDDITIAYSYVVESSSLEHDKAIGGKGEVLSSIYDPTLYDDSDDEIFVCMVCIQEGALKTRWAALTFFPGEDSCVWYLDPQGKEMPDWLQTNLQTLRKNKIFCLCPIQLMRTEAKQEVSTVALSDTADNSYSRYSYNAVITVIWVRDLLRIRQLNPQLWQRWTQASEAFSEQADFKICCYQTMRQLMAKEVGTDISIEMRLKIEFINRHTFSNEVLLVHPMLISLLKGHENVLVFSVSKPLRYNTHGLWQRIALLMMDRRLGQFHDANPPFSQRKALSLLEKNELLHEVLELSIVSRWSDSELAFAVESLKQVLQHDRIGHYAEIMRIMTENTSPRDVFTNITAWCEKHSRQKDELLEFITVQTFEEMRVCWDRHIAFVSEKPRVDQFQAWVITFRETINPSQWLLWRETFNGTFPVKQGETTTIREELCKAYLEYEFEQAVFNEFVSGCKNQLLLKQTLWERHCLTLLNQDPRSDTSIQGICRLVKRMLEGSGVTLRSLLILNNELSNVKRALETQRENTETKKLCLHLINSAQKVIPSLRATLNSGVPLSDEDSIQLQDVVLQPFGMLNAEERDLRLEKLGREASASVSALEIQQLKKEIQQLEKAIDSTSLDECQHYFVQCSVLELSAFAAGVPAPTDMDLAIIDARAICGMMCDAPKAIEGMSGMREVCEAFAQANAAGGSALNVLYRVAQAVLSQLAYCGHTVESLKAWSDKAKTAETAALAAQAEAAKKIAADKSHKAIAERQSATLPTSLQAASYLLKFVATPLRGNRPDAILIADSGAVESKEEQSLPYQWVTQKMLEAVAKEDCPSFRLKSCRDPIVANRQESLKCSYIEMAAYWEFTQHLMQGNKGISYVQTSDSVIRLDIPQILRCLEYVGSGLLKDATRSDSRLALDPSLELQREALKESMAKARKYHDGERYFVSAEQKIAEALFHAVTHYMEKESIWERVAEFFKVRNSNSSLAKGRKGFFETTLLSSYVLVAYDAAKNVYDVTIPVDISLVESLNSIILPELRSQTTDKGRELCEVVESALSQLATDNPVEFGWSGNPAQLQLTALDALLVQYHAILSQQAVLDQQHIKTFAAIQELVLGLAKQYWAVANDARLPHRIPKDQLCRVFDYRVVIDNDAIQPSPLFKAGIGDMSEVLQRIITNLRAEGFDQNQFCIVLNNYEKEIDSDAMTFLRGCPAISIALTDSSQEAIPEGFHLQLCQKTVGMDSNGDSTQTIKTLEDLTVVELPFAARPLVALSIAEIQEFVDQAFRAIDRLIQANVRIQSHTENATTFWSRLACWNTTEMVAQVEGDGRLVDKKVGEAIDRFLKGAARLCVNQVELSSTLLKEYQQGLATVRSHDNIVDARNAVAGFITRLFIAVGVSIDIPPLVLQNQRRPTVVSVGGGVELGMLNERST